MKNLHVFACLVTMLVFTCNSVLAADESSRQYRTRDEKREAAKRYELTDWLSISAIAEIEQIRKRNRDVDDQHFRTDDFSKSMDVELLLEPSERVTGEVVFDFDDEKGKFRLDESFALIDLESFELGLGKLYLPVGEYFSHFISGAPVEFAETRANGAVLTYEPTEELDLSLFAYDGDAEKAGSSSNIDWGLSAELQAFEGVTLGMGYQSDLADASEIDLQESAGRYARRVDGIVLYGVYGLGDFEITAEYATALQAFAEFDSDRDKPGAWNIELAHYPLDKFEWALRLAGSRELEDAPEKQMGVTATWHVHKNASVSLEYLHDDYKAGLAEDDNEHELKTSEQMGGRLTILF